ncbi:MAG: filamentous hemagglutinin N-terminal domain-containing protein [Methylomonas sp.]
MLKVQNPQHAFRNRPGFRQTVLSAVMAACCAASSAVYANPMGGSVVNGTASFAVSGHTLTITNSPGAIIDWSSFSVNKGELTQFIQQTAASEVLNRVTGGDPSQILGSLQSNGRVFLINPNGVVFGAGAQVDVAGIVVSTLKLSDENFLAGKLKFDAQPGAGDINNQGGINATAGGRIILVAPNVENSGVINAPNGDIILAAGKSVNLIDLDHPEISVEISAANNQSINIGQLVAKNISIYGGIINNSGAVDADSAVVGQNGRIILDAQENLTSSGSITADGPSGGSIVLNAGGATRIDGAVEAAGLQSPPPLSAAQPPASQGGTIAVLGNQISLTDNANLNASGNQGGGRVLVGGDEHGQATPLLRELTSQLASYAGSQTETPSGTIPPNASSVVVGSGASIRADAEREGGGGKIIVWADNSAEIAGLISARGGAVSGNGGFVETSGKQFLNITSVPDLFAPNGKSGDWLLDPNNITIQAQGQNANVTGQPNFTSTNDNSIITTASIDAALNAGANVTITTGSGGNNTQAGDINVNDQILKSAGTDATLTLSAYNNINIDAGIGSTAGKLNLTLGADSNSGNSGVSFISSGAAMSLNGGLLSFTHGLQLAGAIENASVISSDASVLNGSNGVLDDVTIMISSGAQAAHSLEMAGTFDLTGGSLTLPGGTAALSGNLTIDGGTLINNGELTLSGNVAALSGAIIGAGDIVAAGSFSKTGSGVFTIAQPLTSTGAFNFSGGAINLANNSALNLQSDTNLANSNFNGIGTVTISGPLQLSTGTLDIGNGINFRLPPGGAESYASAIVNLGSLTFNGGDFTGQLVNSGTFNIAANTNNFTGGLQINNGGTVTGTGGATLNLDNTVLALNGAGSFNINGVNMTNAGAGVIGNGQTLSLSDSAISGINGLTVNGTLNLDNSQIAAPVSLMPGGTLSLQGGTASISQLINNAGYLNVNIGALDLSNSVQSGVINVSSGASLNFSGGNTFNHVSLTGGGDVNFAAGVYGGSGSLNIADTVSVIGNALFNLPVVNNGNLNFSSGMADFADGLTQPSGLSSLAGGAMQGNFNLDGGELAGSGSIIGNVAVGAATVSPGFSPLAVATAGNLIFSGPMHENLSLAGSAPIIANATISSSAVSTGNAPGAITIAGNLNLGANSRLLILLDGLTQGAGYDFVNVQGSANLAGALNVQPYAAFIPPSGSNYYFMDFTSSSGSFASINLPWPGMTFHAASDYLELQMNNFALENTVQTVLQGGLQNPVIVANAPLTASSVPFTSQPIFYERNPPAGTGSCK